MPFRFRNLPLILGLLMTNLDFRMELGMILTGFDMEALIPLVGTPVNRPSVDLPKATICT